MAEAFEWFEEVLLCDTDIEFPKGDMTQYNSDHGAVMLLLNGIKRLKYDCDILCKIMSYLLPMEIMDSYLRSYWKKMNKQV